ncbi:glycosyltransferase family 2 protein [Rhizobium freirei]|uniref:glycosyltransferase family 2 protein n=1 Tax=Rhizobium freirei TaxID=1353277 RepID=UPI00056880E2|nr:glycosyltransferase family 2 protein [Rhizobium freirei]
MTTVPLSVVIPTYRDGKALARALSSIACQTWQPAEIIVVDDAGNDDTCSKFLPAFADLPVKLVTLEQNVGPGGARNAGISASSKPYIAFLDADDEWHSEKVERQMKVMLAPRRPAFSAHLKSFSNQDWSLPSPEQISEFSRWEILLKNPASISTVIIRRDSIHHLFPKWYAGEDYAFVAANLLSGIASLRMNLALARADKPAFGASGLSARMFAMQLGEMRTHRLLAREGLIRMPEYLLLIPWTLIKFARRLMLHRFRARRSSPSQNA